LTFYTSRKKYCQECLRCAWYGSIAE